MKRPECERYQLDGWNIFHYSSVVSSNDVCAQMAARGYAEKSVVVADHQTLGRGRQGRAWVCPPGKGLMMSVLLRPGKKDGMGLLTTAAALSVCRAVDRVTGAFGLIKWPNDVMLNKKKISGILTEGRMAGGRRGESAENSGFAVCGIGINVSARAHELPAGASSLLAETGKAVAHRDLMAGVLQSLEALYTNMCAGSTAGIIEDVWERSMLAGRQVIISGPGGNEMTAGQAIGLAPDGALVIRLDSGVCRTIHSGEVTKVDVL